MRTRFVLLGCLLLLLPACGGGGAPAATPTNPAAAQVAPSATAEAKAPSAEPEVTEEVEPSATPAPSATTEAADSAPEPETATETVEPSATPAPSATAAPVPFDPNAVTVALEPVMTGLSDPIGIAHAGDGSGRLFVVEQRGRIRVIADEQLLPTPLLDISRSVSDGSEQGLLGLAFEPGRPERFYVNYTDLNGDTQIVRYRVSAADPNVADPASAEILLSIPQPAANHNGGHLVFGPDGMLWIGMGDGGASGDRFNNGQTLDRPLGKMLRLDVQPETGFTVPGDGPFANGGAGDPTIWAIGLRNPWRYSFDRATGDLWLADVGQNIWEEVNRVPADAANLNFGWPIQEATHCFREEPCSGEGLVVPVTEYNHDLGCSITGGYVYRGAAFPALQGGYFFSDYCTGYLWAIPADTEGFTEPTIVLETGLNVSAFGEDEAGEVYLVDATDGVLYRIVAQ